jgi:hypothetical protein
MLTILLFFPLLQFFSLMVTCIHLQAFAKTPILSSIRVRQGVDTIIFVLLLFFLPLSQEREIPKTLGKKEKKFYNITCLFLEKGNRLTVRYKKKVAFEL